MISSCSSHTENIVLRHPSQLQARSNNPRTHSPDQIAQIARSIERFGFTNPILIHNDDTVVAGHGRLAAALELGLTKVPTLCLRHLSKAEARAYVIADNQLALNAGWDEAILKDELAFLEDISFETDVLGFEAPEIEALLHGVQEEEEPDLPAVSETAITGIGDVWQLGPHYLVCGSSLDAGVIQTALGGAQASLMLTDPPFNVPIAGHVSSKGHREFAMASGEMSEEQFISFLAGFIEAAKPSLSPRAMAMIAMDWRGLFALETAARRQCLRQVNLCTWVKPNGGMGSLYRSRHELFAIYATAAAHNNNVQLGRFGRNRTNVWEYAGQSGFHADRDETIGLHPTVKPVALLADAMLDVTSKEDWVLDPFAGSGSTLLAAHRVGRRAAGVELDPIYVDRSIRRFETETGISAIHRATGETFAQRAHKAGAA